jgi:hypothetical protein
LSRHTYSLILSLSHTHTHTHRRQNLALQVYVAMCYYKLDYFDVSLEILEPYIEKYKESAIAVNLKACNKYKLFDGKMGTCVCVCVCVCVVIVVVYT